MTFDITGLALFLLAVMPGFVAQQLRHSLVPKPLDPQTALEETGEYVLNSLFVHLLALAVFHVYLRLWRPALLSTFGAAVLTHQLGAWAYDHRYLSILYLCFTLFAGFLLGLLRGYLALVQPVRNTLASRDWYLDILRRLKIPSFIDENPVWYGVFRDQGQSNEVNFVQVRMKSGGYYAGELARYGILKDSEKNKDMYLVNVYFRTGIAEAYQKMTSDGVLISFADVEAVEISKRIADQTSATA